MLYNLLWRVSLSRRNENEKKSKKKRLNKKKLLLWAYVYGQQKLFRNITAHERRLQVMKTEKRRSNKSQVRFDASNNAN